MKQGSQKQRILLIQQALKEHSDQNHPLTTAELVQYCFDHGIQSERKSIYDGLDTLRDFGMDIVYTLHPKRGYFLGNPLFQTAELKLLIDAVQASSFVSAKKSKLLIQKLSSLTSIHEAKRLTRQISYPKNKVMNERIFYTIDSLQQAIECDRPVSFLYFDITVQKQKQYRHHSRRYQLIPYAMVWENQRYYCIGYDQKHRSFSHYRIDKIDNLRILPDPIEKISFDLNEYTSRVFNMYQGKQENIILQVDIALANTIFDQFGQDVLISDVNEENFIIQFPMSIAPTLISWLFQFGQKIKVLSPDLLIEEMKKAASEVLALYP